MTPESHNYDSIDNAPMEGGPGFRPAGMVGLHPGPPTGRERQPLRAADPDTVSVFIHSLASDLHPDQ